MIKGGVKPNSRYKSSTNRKKHVKIKNGLHIQLYYYLEHGLLLPGEHGPRPPHQLASRAPSTPAENHGRRAVAQG